MPEARENNRFEAESFFFPEDFYAFAEPEAVSGNNYLTQNDIPQYDPAPVYPSFSQIKARRERELKKMYVNGEEFLPARSMALLETRSEMPQGFILPSKTINPVNNDWFILIFFGIMILFASVKYLFDSYVWNIFVSIVNFSTAALMFRERNLIYAQSSFKLKVFAYVALGLFFYQFCDYYEMNPFSGFWGYIFIQGIVLAFFQLKKFVYLLLGFISENQTDTSEYLYSFDNCLKVMGMVIISIVAFVAWAPVHNHFILFAGGLALLAIIYISLLLRGILIFAKKQFSIFYLFLYLCILEILPLLVIMKLAFRA